MSEHEPTRKFLESLIQEAGTITLKYFQKNFVVHEKTENQGIVTDADYASESFLKKKIHEKFQTHFILAEESGLEKFSQKNEEKIQPIWIIDPLDGTTNFSKGNPYYCISIAFGHVVENRFHAIIGAIYQPTTQLLFISEKRKGTFLNGKKITMNDFNNFKLASIATGFSSNKEKDLIPLVNTIAAIQNKSLGLRINGAAALDLALTANNIFQGFYETPLAPWDMAAGALIILEAGGVVTNYKGEEFCPLNDKGIIAASKDVFPELFSLIQKNYSI
ncbi:inositol monophosphatase family protein [Fluviispira multicolorata]|uniref:Inositol monophosphatase n=1 Tax=Fluviispira multicolorata TaxID=2654512 RepID=A0A833JEE4_9BACT|nr:inositol monophosphatase family protein [Fluviispira multicolorata]KAB8029829.1 inositol monophosphatase [Fluviispira multicolorata]